MSGKVRVELNTKAVKQLLEGKEVENEVERVGRIMSIMCGQGFKVDVKRKRLWGANRPIAEIHPFEEHSIMDNFKHNTLLKGMGQTQSVIKTSGGTRKAMNFLKDITTK